MAIWAIGDLHLSFGCKDKEMDVFGPAWKEHYKKIETFWDAHVSPDDLVLIPGDISWAMKPEEAIPDLLWIDKRPGTKVMIRGNHDYWWGSASKVRKVLPPSIHIISLDSFYWKGVAVAGARLWDSKEYSFDDCIDYKGPKKEPSAEKEEEAERIFCKELLRLDASLKAMNPMADLKIVMTHYPPIGTDLKDSTVSKMVEQAGVDIVVFGHLHSLRPNQTLFGTKAGVQYHLTSCDWLQFSLLKIR
ncbi:MAG: metallophosphoesterase [Verrucomicrobia bacterium]|nr:metallophosphoesterase [Verrucomicrobiota bacterium]